MSLGTALSSTISGLRVAQSGISVVSRNISNVNTPGYGRGDLVQEASRSTVGVEVAFVRRAAARFLAKASFDAAADVGAAKARSDGLAQAQNAFGDPNSASSVFSRIDQAFGQLQALSANPGSPSQRLQAVNAVGVALDNLEQTQQAVLSVRQDVAQSIPATVTDINTLLVQIADANAAVVRARASGPDAVTAENTRSSFIDQLAELVDIRVSETEGGFAEVRTGAGALLVSVNPARLEAGTAPGGDPTVSLINADGQSSDFKPLVRSGRLSGLFDLATVELPALSEGLSSLALSFASAVNQASNGNTTVPPPNSLQGRDTGLLGTDALNGTGVLTIATTAGDGSIANVLSFDLASYATIDDLTAAINADPSGAATASFSNGRLTLGGAGGAGVIVGGAATRDGVGFSQAFGLNDLVVGGNAALDAPQGLTLRADIAANPDSLPLARPDLVIGAIPRRGDTRGAAALAAAANTTLSVAANALFPAQSGSVGDFAARLASEIGRRAESADSDNEFAQQIRIAADERRTGVEGVNLDTELVRLSQYQLAYQASARVVQVIDDLFDVLLSSVR